MMSKPDVSESLDQQIKHIKADIDRELALFFDHKITEAGRIDSQYKRLVSEMKKFTLRGGKRLRPFMAYLGYQVGGGKSYDNFIRTAMAWELYHSFAVIHDDIMDQDSRRYGGPNITGAYERFYSRNNPKPQVDLHARNASLLAGDVAMGFSFEALMNAPIDMQLRERLVREMLKLHFSLAAGQFLDDVAVLHKDLNPKKIRKIYYYKTARYSMIVPLMSGGLLAGCNDTILDILEKYGRHAGIAYQISDDLLGMFGSSKELGKPVITDLREGKKTILMHYGYKFADATQTKILDKFYGNPDVSMRDLKLVRKILVENGAKAKTIFMARAESESAKQAIGKLALPGELPKIFVNFTDYLIGRSS